MPSSLYWVDLSAKGRLAIMARPRAGDWLEDEIDHWQAIGVDLVVSLLMPEEVAELGLAREASLCDARGVEFVSFPIADRGLPSSRADTVAIADRLATRLGEGASIAIHCRAGIGRSAVLAAVLLTRLGIDADTALARLGACRGVAVPDTEAQRAWVLDFERVAEDAIAMRDRVRE